MKSLVVNKNDANQRIDNFIKKVYPKLSLTQIYKYLRIKRIKVNNKKVPINYQLQLKDKIDLYINDELLSSNNKKDFLLTNKPIEIVYEDDNILLVNKPIGLVVHEDETNNPDTLLNRIKNHLIKKGEWDYQNENSFAPSLVNRIDRNTTGIVIAAKNAESLRILNEKIKNHEIKKTYYARVWGIIDPKQGKLTGFLTKNSKTKMVKISKKPISKDSKQIITKYKTISHDKETSFLEIELITGKTHQIRAHMAFIGHPLVGEQKYSNDSVKKTKGYQHLCAYKIKFCFKTNASILNYLNNKEFKLKSINL